MYKRETIKELFELYEPQMQEYIVNGEVLKASKDIIKKTDEFNGQLTETQKEELENLMELYNARESMLDKHIFEFAFSLAIKLMVEALAEKR